MDEGVMRSDKEMVEVVNLIGKGRSDFGGRFISEGNRGRFGEEGEDYYKELKEVGVKRDLYIGDIGESEEGDGLMVYNIEGIGG
ncbi:hypothetical protein, partial [Paenibacillus xylanexedens]|uniref:hypothetical protein n=1 Tax=Paenibacillus xylanexedens TaxID=528191 RepID=UPI003F7AEEC9